MQIKWKSEKGYTGIDVAVAIGILFIFTLLISSIFANIYLQYSDAQRNAVASAYAVSISELIDKLYYQDVNNNKLSEEIENMNITNGYTVSTNVERYIPEGLTPETSRDVVKIVTINVSYKISNITKNVSIRKIKTKEILITPNRPKLASDMIPVKFVYTNVQLGQGYWQICSENDSTWYNYNNKAWANIMLANNLIVEGDVQVTNENKADLVGKKVTSASQMFEWIPKYAYKAQNNEVTFIYSTSQKYVDSEGNLQDFDENSGYLLNNCFDEITGFWIAKGNYENENINVNFSINATLYNIAQNQKQAVSILSRSGYGTNLTTYSNIEDTRYVIIVK